VPLGDVRHGQRVDRPMTAIEQAANPSPSTGSSPAVEPARRGRIGMVLLATDLSAASDAATTQAIELAAEVRARLLVVNVIEPGARVVGSVNSRIDQLRSEREPSLIHIVGRARRRNVEATFLLWTGEPGRGIVAAAEAEKADMIVVGTRGLDRAGRFLLGSVSDHVVYHARCPVLVAR
jgi:nucleotide-binding universal stress UspA family protein